MTKTRNKGKTRRVIPAEAILTVAEVWKLPKRSQGSKKNPFAKIKRAFQTYINKCPAPSRAGPGLTSAEKRVGILLADWYMPDKRYARASKATIVDELFIGTASVSRALKTLHDLEIVFTKSGGPSRRGSLGAVANKYVPNFWLVINPDTGAIIKNAKYDFSPANPRGCQESLYQSGTRPPLYQNGTRSKRSNPRGCQESLYQTGTVYRSISAGANATPCASADAAATASAAPLKKQFGPLPKHDSDSVKIRFVQLGKLAAKLNKHPVALTKLFAGEGSSEIMTSLHTFCKNQIFTFGRPGNWILEYQLPDHGPEYGRVIIHGDRGRVDFVEDGNGHLRISDLDSNNNSWLAIEYRVSPEYQIEVVAILQELQTGI